MEAFPSKAAIANVLSITRSFEVGDRATLLKLFSSQEPSVLAACAEFEHNQDQSELVNTLQQIIRQVQTDSTQLQTHKKLGDPTNQFRILHLIQALDEDGAMTESNALALTYLAINNEPQVERVFRAYIGSRNFIVLVEDLNQIVDQWRSLSFLGVVFDMLEEAIETEVVSEDDGYSLQFLALQHNPVLLAAYATYLEDNDGDELLESLSMVLARLRPQVIGIEAAIRVFRPAPGYVNLQGATGSDLLGLNPEVEFDSSLAPHVALSILRDVGRITHRDHALLIHLVTIQHPDVNAIWARYQSASGEDPLAWSRLATELEELLSTQDVTAVQSFAPVRALVRCGALSLAERNHLYHLIQDGDRTISKVFECFFVTGDQAELVDKLMTQLGRWKEKARQDQRHRALAELLASPQVMELAPRVGLFQPTTSGYPFEDKLQVVEDLLMQEDPELMSEFSDLMSYTQSSSLDSTALIDDEKLTPFLRKIATLCEKKRLTNEDVNSLLKDMFTKYQFSETERDFLTGLATDMAPELCAACDDYNVSKDADALYCELLELSSAWMESRPQEEVELLELINQLLEAGSITVDVAQLLVDRVYVKDPFLLAAYQLYMDEKPNDSKRAWIEFWDSVALTVKTHSDDALVLETHLAHRKKCLAALAVDDTISRAELTDLEGLLAMGDTCLDAIFSIYEEDGDVDELQDSLVRVAKRWERFTAHSFALDFIRECQANHVFTSGECEQLVEQVCLEHPVIVTSTIRVSKGELYPMPFFQQLVDLLDDVTHEHCQSLLSHALKHVQFLETKLPLADSVYLRDLIHFEDPALFAAIAVDWQISEEARLQSEEPLTVGETDTTDTLARLASRWRRQATGAQQALLMTLELLREHGVLSFSNQEALELMTLRREPELLSRFEDWARVPAQPAARENAALRELGRILAGVLSDFRNLDLGLYVDRALRDMAQSPTPLPEADIAYLRSLVVCKDLLLVGAVAAAVSGSETKDHMEELSLTMRRLASRWRSAAPAEHQALLAGLDVLEKRGIVSRAEHDALEVLVLHKDETLLGHFETWARHPAGPDSDEERRQLLEFGKVILGLLAPRDLDRYTTVALERIPLLISENKLSLAEAEFLTELLQNGDPAVFSALRMYEALRKESVLEVAFSRLSKRWRAQTKHQQALQALALLRTCHEVTPKVHSVLELLVFREHVTTLAALANFQVAAAALLAAVSPSKLVSHSRAASIAASPESKALPISSSSPAQAQEQGRDQKQAIGTPRGSPGSVIPAGSPNGIVPASSPPPSKASQVALPWAELLTTLAHVLREHGVEVDSYLKGTSHFTHFVHDLHAHGAISLAGLDYLTQLAANGDPELAVALSTFRQRDDSTELTRSLRMLSTRWIVQSQYRDAVALLHRSAQLTRGETALIENLLYSRDPALIRALDLFVKTVAKDSSLSAEVRVEAEARCLKDVLAVLEAHYHSTCDDLRDEVNYYLTRLQKETLGLERTVIIPPADLWNINRMKETLHPALYGAVSLMRACRAGRHGERASTAEDWDEVKDTLLRLAGRWRISRETPRRTRSAVLLVDYLIKNHFITEQDKQDLDLAIVKGNELLLNALDLYRQHQHRRERHTNPSISQDIQDSADDNDPWEDVWDAVLSIVQEAHEQRVAKFTGDATQYVERRVEKKELSTAGAAYLRDMIDECDPVFLASFLVYEETQDAEELYDTIVLLSNRWKKKLGEDEETEEERENATTQQNLLVLLQDLLQGGTLDAATHDCLEHLVYIQDPVLVGAFLLYQQATEQADLPDDDDGVEESAIQKKESDDGVDSQPSAAAEGMKNIAWTELWDTIARILDDRLGVQRSTHLSHFRECVTSLTNENMITATDAQHLINQVNSAQGHPVAEAAFLHYLELNNLGEFQDTLRRVATVWRTKVSSQWLAAIKSLSESGKICKLERDWLEKRLLEGDPLFKESAQTTQFELIEDLLASEYATYCMNRVDNPGVIGVLELLTRHNGQFPLADLTYLHHLAETCDVTVFAALDTHLTNQAQAQSFHSNKKHKQPQLPSSDVLDTLSRLGARWRRMCTDNQRQLLTTLGILQKHGHILHEELQALEVQVYNGDPVLEATHLVFVQNRDLKEFLDTIARILDMSLQPVMESLGSSGLDLLSSHQARFSEPELEFLTVQFKDKTAPFHSVAIAAISSGVIPESGKLAEEEVVDSLARVAKKWEQTLDSQRKELLSIIRHIAQFAIQNPGPHHNHPPLSSPSNRLLGRPCPFQTLERLVCVRDPVLLAAHTLALEEGPACWSEFFETLQSIVATKVSASVRLPSLQYMIEVTLDKLELSRLQKTRLLTLAQERNHLLESCFGVHLSGLSLQDTKSALIDLSERWRRQGPNPAVIDLLSHFEKAAWLLAEERETLIELLCLDDPGMVAASKTWAKANRLTPINLGSPNTATVDFHESLVIILKAQSVKKAQALCNSSSEWLPALKLAPLDAEHLLHMLAQPGEPGLVAAVMSTIATQNSQAMHDVRQLAQNWRQHPKCKPCLEEIQNLTGELAPWDVETLERLVYEQSPDLQAALFHFNGEPLHHEKRHVALQRLLDQQARLSTFDALDRANQYLGTIDNTQLSPASALYLATLLQESDTQLLALFAESDPDSPEELLDSVLRLSRRWRRLECASSEQQLLNLIDTMHSKGLINRAAVYELELLVFKQDSSLIAAYQLLMEPSRTELQSDIAWLEFLDTIGHLVKAGDYPLTHHQRVQGVLHSLEENGQISRPAFLLLTQRLDNEPSDAVLSAMVALYLETNDEAEFRDSLLLLAKILPPEREELLNFISNLHEKRVLSAVQRNWLEELEARGDLHLETARRVWSLRRENRMDPARADQLLQSTLHSFVKHI